MPKHPDTGEEISRPVYEAIMAERKRAETAVDAAVEAERLAIAKKLEEEAEPERPTATPAWTPAPQPTYIGASPYGAPEQSSKSSNLLGCLVVFLILAVFGLGGFLVYRELNPPQPAPSPPVVVVPTGNLDAIVAPIKAKLAYDPVKAAAVYQTYAGFADAIAGKSGDRVTGTAVLEQVQKALLTDVDAGAGTPIGAEIDAAIGAHLGIAKSTDPKDPGWDPKTFTPADRTKLVEVLRAISRAGEASL